MIQKILYLNIIVIIFAFVLIKCEKNPVENKYYIIDCCNTSSNPDSSLKVVHTYPSQNSTGPFINLNPTNDIQYPQVTIQFNKLIDRSFITGNDIFISTGNKKIDHYSTELYSTNNLDNIFMSPV